MLLFDMISPIYGLFFRSQEDFYGEVLEKVSGEIDFNPQDSVLDIGCGTGALCKAFYHRGLMPTGVDPSKGMLSQAKKKLRGLPIELIHIDSGQSLPFPDKSFDIVIASYVAHGISGDERMGLYREMERLARKLVIIHDYNENRALLTSLVEWLENGDYFNFIKVAKEEMREVFKNVSQIDVGARAAWYICRCTK
ncbi:MAG: class I SAM-dependent methyltransferase [Tissierellaceae bacterium]